MDIDPKYTIDDHQVRDEDAYALSKYRITLNWLRKHSVGSSSRLLNVGAGSGLFSEMADQEGFAVTNLEPDSSAADVAEARLGAGTVIRSSIFDFHPSERFQVVVMHDVLEHIGDDLKALEIVRSVMEPSSSIFLGSVPAWRWLYGFHDEQLGHFRRYSPRSLRDVLSPSFEIRSIRHLGVLGIPAAVWFSRIRRTAYPVGSGGLVEKVFAASCRLEERARMPIGSSLIWVCIPRR